MAYSVLLTSSMSASVYSLQQIAKLMTESNEALATGKEVNSALDDPIRYFASQDHEYRASDLEARKDEMNEAIQLVEAADSGIEALLDLVDSAMSLANSALVAEDATEIASLEASFNDILAQIDLMAADSYYKGTNLLGGLTEQLTVYFDEDGTSSLTLTGFDASSAGLSLVDPAGSWDDGTGVPDEAGIQASLDALTDAKNLLRTEQKDLAMNLTIIETRVTFTEEMVTTLTDGASQLVSVDENAESAILLMLETQQSLATNSLSMGSDAYSSVLQLFQ